MPGNRSDYSTPDKTLTPGVLNGSPAETMGTFAKSGSASKAFSKFRLRTMLVVPFVLQIFIAVSLVGWLSFRSGQKAVNNLATQLRYEVSDRVSQHLSTYLATPVQINQTNLDAYQVGILNLLQFDQVGQYFYRQMKLYPEVGYINFGSKTGEFIGVGREDDGSFYREVIKAPRLETLSRYALNAQGSPTKLLATESYKPRKDGWYLDAVKARKPVWSQIYQWPDQPEVFSISASYPVYDANKTFLGVIGVDLILSQINSYLNTLTVSPSAKIFILERNGLLVAQSGADKPYRIVNGQPQRIQASESTNELTRLTVRFLTKFFGSLDAIQQKQLLNFKFKRDRQFVQVTPWKDPLGLDWLIVIAVPESDFMGQINANTHNTLWLCLGALAVAIGIGILTARWITRPILKVTQASEQIAAGDLEQHVKTRGIIELEKLADSFNRMADQLKGSFEELAAKNTDLQHSENRNQAFLNAIPDLILRVSSNGTYLDVIEAKGVGIVTSRQDRLGKSVYDVLPAELAQQYMQCIEQALQTNETQGFEYQLMVHENLADYEARIVASGTDEAIFIVRNISDRKQAEAALRQSEANNRALVTAMPDLLIRARGDGIYLDIAGRDRLRVMNDPQFSVGSSVYDSLPLDKARVRMHHIQQALQTGEMQIYEQEFVSDGQTLHEEVRIVVSSENEVLIMVRDITARKRAEEALRIAEEKYRSIFENALEGIFQSSPDGHFISVNPAMANIYGYSSPEDMIASITQIETQTYVDPQGREDFKRLMNEQGEVKDLEYQIYRKDGRIIWIEENTRAVRDIHGNLLYYEGILEDITQRKQLEEELKRQLQELRIEIDHQKREREVSQITQSDYFQELKTEVSDLNVDDFWTS